MMGEHRGQRAPLQTRHPKPHSVVQPACRSTAAKGARKCVSEGVREGIRMGLHGGLRQGAYNIVCDRIK